MHWIGTDALSGCAPHQSQKRASALFKRKHFEQVIIVPVGLGANGMETVACTCCYSFHRKSNEFSRMEIHEWNFTGDVVGMSLLSQIMHVRKCMGFVALHCGHKIFVFEEKKKFSFQ